MSKNQIDKLNSALDKYDQKQNEIKKSNEKKKTEHEIYLDNFKQKCKDVIRPTMEEIGNIIKERGHQFKIKQNDESIDRDRKTTAARIELEIYPEGKQPDYINLSFPHISFIAGTYDNKTYDHISTMMPGRGGSTGKRNEYELSEITKEVVQEKIINLITECFTK